MIIIAESIQPLPQCGIVLAAMADGDLQRVMFPPVSHPSAKSQSGHTVAAVIVGNLTPGWEFCTISQDTVSI